MTDLLTSASAGGSARDTADGGPQRPLAIGAALAGLASAGAMLLGCMAVALAGWFASDAGGLGPPRDALRVGADAWLLAHGSPLELPAATISVVPLGLTLLCAYVTFRLGRWAAETSAAQDAATVLLGGTVLAGVYGVVAIVTAVLASSEQAQPHLGRAFVGAAVVSVLGGGTGLVAGSGLWPSWRDRLPQSPLAVATGACAGVLLVVAAASSVLVVALLLDLGSAANVLSRLHADVSGGLLYTTLVAAVAPNAVLLTGAYLLGPGFAVGTGTLVSPSVVVLGPVPAFPLLAALPDEGAQPWWTTLLVALPPVLAAVAAALMVRRFPAPVYELGALRGLCAGTLGGLLLALLTALAGGSVGPGRMAHVGADRVETLVAATVAMGLGGLAGGLAATWSVRRAARRSTAATASE